LPGFLPEEVREDRFGAGLANGTSDGGLEEFEESRSRCPVRVSLRENGLLGRPVFGHYVEIDVTGLEMIEGRANMFVVLNSGFP
jgi:hypothetical protein